MLGGMTSLPATLAGGLLLGVVEAARRLRAAAKASRMRRCGWCCWAPCCGGRRASPPPGLRSDEACAGGRGGDHCAGRAAAARFRLPARASSGFVAAYAIAGLGLVVLAGHGGQVSLGQAAFLGVGAYAEALPGAARRAAAGLPRRRGGRGRRGGLAGEPAGEAAVRALSGHGDPGLRLSGRGRNDALGNGDRRRARPRWSVPLRSAASCCRRRGSATCWRLTLCAAAPARHRRACSTRASAAACAPCATTRRRPQPCGVDAWRAKRSAFVVLGGADRAGGRAAGPRTGRRDAGAVRHRRFHRTADAGVHRRRRAPLRRRPGRGLRRVRAERHRAAARLAAGRSRPPARTAALPVRPGGGAVRAVRTARHRRTAAARRVTVRRRCIIWRRRPGEPTMQEIPAEPPRRQGRRTLTHVLRHLGCRLARSPEDVRWGCSPAARSTAVGCPARWALGARTCACDLRRRR
ncbi:MAG: hypothetical protein MZW92_64795 [Comamonadaceae bacterium]|nr:hypothetical protein [Comamonadaceae bacterium]